MNYQLRGPFGLYLNDNKTSWRGNYGDALSLRWHLAQQGQPLTVESRKHGTGQKCYRFCESCEIESTTKDVEKCRG